MKKYKISYASTGVDYTPMDYLKRLAQKNAKKTAKNLLALGMGEVQASRGEAAYVWEEKNAFRAFVIEGLGTKNLVADSVRKFSGKTHYDTIAQDTIAMIVNDLIVVGARPQVINAYFAVGNANWFSDKKRVNDLVTGWKKACDIAGASWGGGETPTLKGIINHDTIDLSGAAVGIISPKKRLTLGERLKVGDAIVLIESSGIHSNGLTLARTISEKLPKGYKTKLSDGATFGETILMPTHIYTNLVKDCFDFGIDIHYMVNITGHGWRKIMRANKNFIYRIKTVPTPPLIFTFIQKYSGNDDKEMYGNFNMGAGFALMVPKDQAKKVVSIAKKRKLKAWDAGVVEKGSKQVIIEPKNIIFSEKLLQIR